MEQKKEEKLKKLQEQKERAVRKYDGNILIVTRFFNLLLNPLQTLRKTTKWASCVWSAEILIARLTNFILSNADHAR